MIIQHENKPYVTDHGIGRIIFSIKIKGSSKEHKCCKRNILSAGSVDSKFATCAAEASKPSRSSGASSEISPTSNPKTHESYS